MPGLLGDRHVLWIQDAEVVLPRPRLTCAPTSLNGLPYQVGEDGPHILQQLASSGLDSLKGTRVQICAPNFDVFLTDPGEPGWENCAYSS